MRAASRLIIWRRAPRRSEQAESLKPSTLRAVVVLQRNGLEWYPMTVGAARCGDRDERARARTGLYPAPQRGLNVRIGMGGHTGTCDRSYVGANCHACRMISHRIVAVILRQADQVLLCHRATTRRWYPDVWDFPGGHVERDERPEDALRREISEELGVELAGVDGAPVLHRVVPDAGLDLTV